MSERLNKTSICTVIFVGIVDYAQMPVDGQIALKERFNALINEAVADIAQNDRIILDTGEGAAIALLGAPEDALSVAINIRDGVVQDREKHPDGAISVRIGINLGPVRVVNDLNDRRNVVGDGINAAQRVMSFAHPGRILVSRSYYEIASRLSAELAGMFRYLGVKTDKVEREHEVYSVLDDALEEIPLEQEVVAVAAELQAQPVVDQGGRWRTPVFVAFAGAIALALVWGYWVSRPAGEEKNSEPVAEVGGKMETVAEEVSSEAPPVVHREKKKSKPKQPQGERVQSAAHETGSSESQQEQTAESQTSTPVSAEPERSSLCSDAQRMLKQC